MSKCQRSSRLVALVLLIIFSVQPALGHNEIVHRDMVDLTYQLMRLSLAPTRGQAITVFAPPEGSDPNEWAAFLAAVRSAPPKFRNRPSDLGKLKPPKTTTCSEKMYQDQVLPDRWWDKKAGELTYPVAIDFEDSGDCGANSDYKPGGIFEPVDPEFDRRKLDHTGTTLGFWTASVDRQLNDTHLWFRPTNAGALGAAKKFIDDLGDKGLGALLLPIVCGLNCLFDDCDGCDEDAKDIADAVNVLDDTSGWLPGTPGIDISGADWTGVWHHINMTPRATNQYDDRQGEFFEEAGPDFPPDAVDLVLMAAFDASGLSVNYEQSRGVANYQIQNADDGHANTKIRNHSQWQFTTIAHTPFEPVDNLGYYGWRIFRDQPDHPLSSLGLPLHALGDATVPMHVTATSAWGHRPFEDAQERLWAKIRMIDAIPEEQERLLRDILLRGFEWWKFIRNWRTAHPGHATDTPVREMTTELAKRTYDYSMLTYQQTGQRWPFDRGASTLYLTKQDDAINQYKNFPNSDELVRPLFVDGMGATLALIVSASELLPPG
jgi:hypothetical protein